MSLISKHIYRGGGGRGVTESITTMSSPELNSAPTHPQQTGVGRDYEVIIMALFYGSWHLWVVRTYVRMLGVL